MLALTSSRSLYHHFRVLSRIARYAIQLKSAGVEQSFYCT